MKIGVFVGSFNPPHDGHMHIAKYLINNYYVDKVLILPTPNYWDKQDLVSIKDRVNMLKFYEEENIIIDDIHNNYLYTYLVLKSLKKDYSKDSLYLIIGSDNVKDLDKWKQINYILKYKIIVMNRGDNIDKYINKLGKEHFIIIDNFPFINISSTKIRKGQTKFINVNVLKYIKEHNLYK